MTPTETTSKRLSGGARGLLNDLILLNDKTRQEMERGVTESYLDRNGAFALAEELGIEPPRIKKRFYRYFTQTTVFSVPIDAYTEEEADAEAARMQEINVSQGDIHFGNRSRFDRDDGRITRVHSLMSAQRPKVADMPNVHPWELERIQAEGEGRPNPLRSRDINWNSVIPR